MWALWGRKDEEIVIEEIFMEPYRPKPPVTAKSHLAAAFRWSTEAKTDWVEILASAIGMAVPILLGAAVGELALGFGVAVGSMLVGGTAANNDWRAQGRALIAALVPAALAAVVAVAVAGHSWMSDVAVVLLAGAAGAVAAMGRPVATMAIRFILLLIITITVAENIPDRVGLLFLIAAGALWTSAMSLLLGALARARRGRHDASGEAAPPPITLRQRIARWRRALVHLAGWQYALRLMICLSIAGALRWLWPDHHLRWIALTVVLLAEWQIDAFPVRTTQRALGAAVGVLATGLLLIYTPPAWTLVVVMGVLAGLRPLLRARNYLAYTAAMTPLIILLLDAGQAPGLGVLIDRLVATLIGAALVIATNLLFKKLIGKTV
jgi:Fusaric acid resistance protein-like